MSVTAKRIAKSEKEWWNIMREECRAHNSESHMDDQIDLNEWPGMYVGTVAFGYLVEVEHGSYTGYRLTKQS